MSPTPYNDLDSEIGAELDDLNFSPPPEKSTNIVDSSGADNSRGGVSKVRKSPSGVALKGEPYMSLGDFMRQPVNGTGGETYAEAFYNDWMARQTGEKTEKSVKARSTMVRSYVRRLKEMDWYYVPSDIKDVKVLMDSTMDTFRSASAFLTYYYESRKDDQEKAFNGYSIDDFKGVITVAKRTYTSVYMEEGEEKTYDATSEEIKQVISYIGNETGDKATAARAQILVYIGAYCGARMSQIWDYFKSTPPGKRKLTFYDKRFFRIDVSKTASGHKNARYYYLPIGLKSAVLSMTVDATADAYGKLVAAAGGDNGEWKQDKDENDKPLGEPYWEARPITYSTLRKYNQLNMVLADIMPDVASAMQGRRNNNVDAQHYIDYGDKTAIKEYPKLLERLDKELPIPDWIVDYNDGDKTPDIAVRPDSPEVKRKKRRSELSSDGVKRTSEMKKGSERQAHKFAPITQEDKDKIIELHRQGISGNAIVKMTPYARATVQKVIKEYKGL